MSYEDDIDKMIFKKEQTKVESDNEEIVDMTKQNDTSTIDAIPKDLSVTDLDLQSMKTQSSLDKAFQELFNEISLEKKTEFLKNDEIKILGTLYSNARYYGFTALQERIIKHMQMRISLKRKGRNEAVEIVKAEREHEEIKNMMLNKYTRKE